MRVRICGISILFLQTQQTVQHFLSERRVYTVQPDDNSGHQRRRSDSCMVHVRVQPIEGPSVLWYIAGLAPMVQPAMIIVRPTEALRYGVLIKCGFVWGGSMYLLAGSQLHEL